MQFRLLTEEDWRQFMCWAAQENWRVSFQEQRLLQSLWRPYFFALYKEGVLRGFVSAVAYKESGWIGNLLVPEKERGKGFGSALFDYALQFLQKATPTRVWLTASAAGQPIYERRGFKVIDRIDRWATGGQGGLPAEADAPVADLVALDTVCWGESRSPLINALSDDGSISRAGKSMGLLQPGVDAWQFGPWLSPDRNVVDNRKLLQLVVSRTPPGKDLLVDVLHSSEMELVLRTSGFERRGSNQLMVLSDEPVSLNGVMALASLGSIG
ncbi:Acetyltransferase (GNAT) domain-containing protein [Malonomonas rubra DSM 5091]|uniref:Acetyltransferase (GNAT) domain-containing protein n=1 Tax=Malonomonas rubra DSM 5091 TaxID=1122189 RepID=A0A1M6N2N0_MALRU|nr:GNAT family N-acetyltransferase [Malonomonas rubra]SHJ89947.1 Acetyltransferase (GNAT) domain-containing protein [Malonomonas rubra DSM 5091]